MSLLAVAQDQKVIPSIQSIQDINTSLSEQFLQEMNDDIQKSLKEVSEQELTIRIYFGDCPQQVFSALAKRIYEQFPLPLLVLSMSKQNDLWSVKSLSTLTPKDIPVQEKDFMQEKAKIYLNKKCFYAGPNKKEHFFHLAILTEPEEETPPSTPETLEKFAKAGESMGFQVDFISKNDIKMLPEYAGLFIRATSTMNHYTYQFARYAAQENIVVIDDPQSIVKCRNKVYQAVSLQNHHIKTPHTIIVSKHQQNKISIPFPCVIKRPDSGYSLGVVKADNEKELKKILDQFFEFSDLVIVQAFLPTEFDWRIGILDRKPLYAMRYYMAKNHWQIVNWASTIEDDQQGDADCISIEDVPEGVIQIALKAANLMGDGLYGVDVKTHGADHYLIEVNCNPSIQEGCENIILGDELYKKIMSVFLQRMQVKHGMQLPPVHEEFRSRCYRCLYILLYIHI